MPVFSPSGGLVYHARALRDARTRWAPFREAVGAWLSRWEPSSKSLLLIGPSGGYTLPTAWLKRFENVVAVDFDPLARAVFSRRHRLPSVEWIEADVLPTTPTGLDLAPLRRLLDERPDHAVLFSNVLGQVALGSSDPDAVERELARLRTLLEDRRWASYHDRLSAPLRPSLPRDLRHRSDLELARTAYAQGGEIASHATGQLGRGLPCETFAWECQRGHWNLIEACHDRLESFRHEASQRERG